MAFKQLKVYRPVPGSHVRVKDAQIIGVTLEKISRERGAHADAEAFLNEASKKKSPAHHLFIWNNSKAAHIQRLDRARYLMRSISIVVMHNSRPTPTRAVPVIKVPKQLGRYTPIGVVMRSRSKSKEIVEEAARQLQAWVNKYEKYLFLTNTIGAVQQALKTLRRGL